jgi:hypothetical protein
VSDVDISPSLNEIKSCLAHSYCFKEEESLIKACELLVERITNWVKDIFVKDFTVIEEPESVCTNVLSSCYY